MNIPLGGTIPRCPHGVYKPETQVVAHGCSFCNTTHFAAIEQNTRVPVFSRKTQHDPELPWANKKRPATCRCPNCDSNVHYESEIAGGPWECADCGHKFKGRAE